MKKWYFSHKGNISGPLDLANAREFVTNNQAVYVWHPTFVQWKPCSIVPELADLITDNKPSVNYFSELIEKFGIKKIRLERKLEQINQHIAANEENFSVLDAELATYRKLTVNLSEGVKGAITTIEQKKVALREKQNLLENAVAISLREINTLMQQFTAQIDAKANIQVDGNLAVKILLPSINNKLSPEDVTLKQSKPENITNVDNDVNRQTNHNVVQLTPSESSPKKNIKAESLLTEDQQIHSEKINTVKKTSLTNELVTQEPAPSKAVNYHFSQVDKKERKTEVNISPNFISRQSQVELSTSDQTINTPTAIHALDDAETNQKISRKNFPGVSNLLKSVFKVNEIKAIEPAIDENVRISKRFLLQTNAKISTRPLTEFSDEELITKDRKAKRHRRRR